MYIFDSREHSNITKKDCRKCVLFTCQSRAGHRQRKQRSFQMLIDYLHPRPQSHGLGLYSETGQMKIGKERTARGLAGRRTLGLMELTRHSIVFGRLTCRSLLPMMLVGRATAVDLS